VQVPNVTHSVQVPNVTHSVQVPNISPAAPVLHDVGLERAGPALRRHGQDQNHRTPVQGVSTFYIIFKFLVSLCQLTYSILFFELSCLPPPPPPSLCLLE
jgi:hypothetical protein